MGYSGRGTCDMKMGMSYEEAVILAELRDRFLRAVSESYPDTASSEQRAVSSEIDISKEYFNNIYRKGKEYKEND